MRGWVREDTDEDDREGIERRDRKKRSREGIERRVEDRDKGSKERQLQDI